METTKKAWGKAVYNNRTHVAGNSLVTSPQPILRQ
jgi:hypothetical protein